MSDDREAAVDRVLAASRAASRDDRAVDSDGAILPIAPADVRAQANSIVERPDAIPVLVVAKDPDSGDLGARLYGPPDLALVEELEQFVRGLRSIVEGVVARTLPTDSLTAKVRAMIERGRLRIVVGELDGEVAFEMLGPPTPRLVDALEQAADAMRIACATGGTSGSIVG